MPVKAGQVGDHDPDRGAALPGPQLGGHGVAGLGAVDQYPARGERYREPAGAGAEFEDAAVTAGGGQRVDGRARANRAP